jgi:C4-dicarboxylate-binding protein DctP
MHVAQLRRPLLALAASTALLWSACAPAPPAPTTTTAPAAQPAAAKYTLRYGHNHATTTSQHEAIEYFKKLVEERSGGAIQVQVFPASQLGGNREQAEGVGLGTIDLTQQPASVATIFGPELVALDLPYLFPSEESALRVLNGPIGDELMRGLEAKGIRGMSFWPTGFNQITTATQPIRTPDDLKGLKIRVLPSQVLTATYTAWGASPTPIDFKELYTALQQRVVDGQENPLLSIVQIKLYEVQKFVSLTDHRLFLYITMISKQTFDSLPPDLQQVVLQADRDAQTEYLKLFRREEEAGPKVAEENGMTIVRLTAEQKDLFLKAAEPVYGQFADQVGRDLLQRMRAAARSS